MEYPKVKRNVLLNPGPATTTDTVKYAQVVPDICPREKEFGDIMKKMGEDLVKIVHGDLNKYTAVLFTGSGTINIDACVNSLVPEGKKILVLNNGAYSGRAAEVAEYYHMDRVNLKLPITEPIDVDKAEEAIRFHVDERSIQRDIDDIRIYLADRKIIGLGECRNIIYDRMQKGYVMR